MRASRVASELLTRTEHRIRPDCSDSSVRIALVDLSLLLERLLDRTASS